MKRWVFPLLLAASSLLASLHCRAASDVWQTGCARVEITPQEPTWMAGFAFRTRPSDGVRMPLWAKALVLEDAGGKRGVIVTMDILTIPRDFSDAVRDRICQKYGLSRSQIILNASHTHSGPVVGDALYYIYPMGEQERNVARAYRDTLVEKTLDVIDRAWENRRPSRISTGCGMARFAVNRRHNPSSPSPVEPLLGPGDWSVPVLKVEDMDGRVKTILFGYACHATTLFDNAFSGDYPGFAQQALETHCPGATAMFFQGCGADQNPLPRGRTSLAIQYGHWLAASVEQVLSEEMVPCESRLETCYEEIPLPFDTPPARAGLEEMAGRPDYMGRWASGMLGRMDSGERFPETYPCPVAFWQVGAQGIFALGGEVVSEYAIFLKKRYGASLFVMGYCNDVMTYIPSASMFDEGGYEVIDAAKVYNLPAGWTTDVERVLLEGIERMMKTAHFVKREENEK